MSLIGKHNRYTFGEKIKVKCISASSDTMTVDFALGDDDEKKEEK